MTTEIFVKNSPQLQRLLDACKRSQGDHPETVEQTEAYLDTLPPMPYDVVSSDRLERTIRGLRKDTDGGILLTRGIPE